MVLFQTFKKGTLSIILTDGLGKEGGREEETNKPLKQFPLTVSEEAAMRIKSSLELHEGHCAFPGAETGTWHMSPNIMTLSHIQC